MLAKKILILFILFFAGISLIGAQKTVITGKVTDKANGESLPFVSIVFQGTTIGVQSDLDGNFKLDGNNIKSKTIVVAYLGYKQIELPFTIGETQEINIELEPDSEVLKEVVIKADRKVKKDTAAIALFRKVVRNKPNNRSGSLDFYSFEEYTKTEFDLYNLSEKFKNRKILKPFEFVFENVDTSETGKEYLPVLLKERLADVYYSNYLSKEKTVVKADNFSGIDNVSIAELIEYSFEEIDIYANMNRVSGVSFIMPFAGGALATYKYFLADSAYVDGLWCYKLEFTGKRKQDKAFSGYAWIHDGTFAIKSIDMYVLPDVNINFVNSFSVRQTFTYYKERYWFKESEYVHTSMNLSKNEEKQSFMIRKNASRRNIVLNVPIPDKIFKGDAVEVLVGARDKKLEYWSEKRHQKLTKKEKKIYATIDSMKNTRAYKNLAWIGYLGSTGFMKAGPVEFGRAYTFFSWNEVEGKRYKFGGRTTAKLSKKFQLDSYVAYGAKDSAWKYDFGLKLHLNRKNNRWHMLSANYRFDLIQLNLKDPLLTHDNLALSILRSEPLSDLLKIRRLSVEYEREWLKGLSTTMQFLPRTFYSVPTGFSFSVPIVENGGPVDTVDIDRFKSTELRAKLVWGKEQKFYESHFLRFPITFHKPVFHIDYAVGVKGFLGGEFNYHKLELGVFQKLSNPFGLTRYQVTAGKVFGKAPIPLLKLHKGNQTFLLNKDAYHLMNEFEFASDEYAEVWVEHHFNGLILNTIPLIKKLKWRSFGVFRMLAADLDPEKANLMVMNFPNKSTDPMMPSPQRLTGLNGLYMEAGFGIENIFKIMRVDFIWRLTQLDRPSSTKFGFKIGFQPEI